MATAFIMMNLKNFMKKSFRFHKCEPTKMLQLVFWLDWSLKIPTNPLHFLPIRVKKWRPSSSRKGKWKYRRSDGAERSNYRCNRLFRWLMIHFRSFVSFNRCIDREKKDKNGDHLFACVNFLKAKNLKQLGG